MEIHHCISLKKQWRRRNYKRMHSNSNPTASERKSMPIVRLGGKKAKRVWRIRSIPKFQLKLLSPLTLWKKFKNTYTDMMLKLAGNVGSMSDRNAFAVNRITAAAAPVEPLPYDKNEFENRLIYEIYKSLVASMELNSKQSNHTLRVG